MPQIINKGLTKDNMAGNSNAGRKPLTDDERDEIFRKLEPYLKSGLSVNKACLEAKIPKSTVYDEIGENTIFAEKIEGAKNFQSIMLSNFMMREMSRIMKKQEGTVIEDKDGNKVREYAQLDGSEVSFMQWVATNSKSTQEEFGKRQDINLIDPQVELKKLNDLINEAADDEYDEETNEPQEE